MTLPTLSESEKLMRILSVNNFDVASGAERICQLLVEGYTAAGHEAFLGVADIRGEKNKRTVALQRTFRLLDIFRFLHRHTEKGLRRIPGAWRIGNMLEYLSRQTWWQSFLSSRVFYNPASANILRTPPGNWDLLHIHSWNECFDLRALPSLCPQIPIAFTLHDAILFTGACGHPKNCTRWQEGCGHISEETVGATEGTMQMQCSLSAATTRHDWNLRKRLFEQSHLFVATPCQWLMDMARSSVAAPAMLGSRVIHNGIDLSIFAPGDKAAARHALNLEQDRPILLMAATAVRNNRHKDFSSVREALMHVADAHKKRPLLLLGLGQDAPTEYVEGAEIRFIPFLRDAHTVAQYYRAADVYVHAALGDTFPTTILEAMATGTPVIASNICGIPEQVIDITAAEGATGILTPVTDASAMANAIKRLLADAALRHTMGEHARRRARQEFDQVVMVQRYLDWYAEIREEWQAFFSQKQSGEQRKD